MAVLSDTHRQGNFSARASSWQDLSLQSVFFQQELRSHTTADLLSGANDKSLAGVRMQTALFAGHLKGEGEVADSRPSGLGDQEKTHESRYRLVRFGLTGGKQMFRYGASYRIAGEGFAELQDYASREIWGEWRFGTVGIKSTLKEGWNNVAADPHRVRLTGQQERADLFVTHPGWPKWTLSFSRDSLSSSLDPTGIAPQRTVTHTIETGLSYNRLRWSAQLTTIYFIRSDVLMTNGETVGLTHVLSGNYRAGERLMIVPVLSMKEDVQRWSGVRLATPSASLAVSYMPHAAINFKAQGSISQTRSSDGLVDSSLSKITSALIWTRWHTRKLRSILSLDASYTTSLEAAGVSRSTEDLVGLLRLQFTGP